eukprot:c19197_g1_i1.p1 GENE.c19197_g1_i1~~c19197_g1_i1.p1  ORF type:complete len:313 (+),score=63.94 c19197_g1_i1:42-980(+)
METTEVEPNTQTSGEVKNIMTTTKEADLVNVVSEVGEVNSNNNNEDSNDQKNFSKKIDPTSILGTEKSEERKKETETGEENITEQKKNNNIVEGSDLVTSTETTAHVQLDTARAKELIKAGNSAVAELCDIVKQDIWENWVTSAAFFHFIWFPKVLGKHCKNEAFVHDAQDQKCVSRTYSSLHGLFISVHWLQRCVQMVFVYFFGLSSCLMGAFMSIQFTGYGENLAAAKRDHESKNDSWQCLWAMFGVVCYTVSILGFYFSGLAFSLLALIVFLLFKPVLVLCACFTVHRQAKAAVKRVRESTQKQDEPAV